MLTLIIPSKDYFDPSTSELFTIDGCKLTLEHSLVSISKWEAEHLKSFFSFDSKNPMTVDEARDYIRAMTITQNVDPLVYYNLTNENIKKAQEYIDNPMSATTFTDRVTNKPVKKHLYTSEEIYSFMVMYNIPFECQKWHLNRLLNLIKCCEIHNSPGKKMSRKDILSRNKSLNAARRAALNTTG